MAEAANAFCRRLARDPLLTSWPEEHRANQLRPLVEGAWPRRAIDFEAALRGSLEGQAASTWPGRSETQPALRPSEVRPTLQKLGLLDFGAQAGAAEVAPPPEPCGPRRRGLPWPLVQRVRGPARSSRRDRRDVLRDGTHGGQEDTLDVAGRALALDILTEDVCALSPVSELRAAPRDPVRRPSPDEDRRRSRCHGSRARTSFSPPSH